MSLFYSFWKRGKCEEHKSSLHPSDCSQFIFNHVTDNLTSIARILNAPHDLITRTFKFGQMNQTCAVVYIDGLVDKELLHDNIIKRIQINMSEHQELEKGKISLQSWKIIVYQSVSSKKQSA
ncbi:spore germination protein [Priestia megaterium]|nr:spore germination protein [Priestia megaterium]